MLIPALVVVLLLFFCFLLLSLKLYLCMKKAKNSNNSLSFGFFHPYCNAGGGGERVLWAAIRSIQKRYKDAHCVVYSGDAVTTDDMIKTVDLRFNIKLSRKIDVIYLKSRFLVEAKYYPLFTLLMQSLASVVLGLEAIIKYVPDIYIDTMGYSWTYPLFKHFGSCKVAAYVHYPTISTDMLKIVEKRQTAVNNRRFISKSIVFSYLKLFYYKIFAYFYGLVGRQAAMIMVNSTWTKGHIVDLWKKPEKTFIVYPPCDVSEFSSIPLEMHDDKINILSIAQFRPEKNHELQIRAFHEFLQRSRSKPPTLIMAGSCRHAEDYERTQDLLNLCDKLGISQNVELKINLSFDEIMELMKNCNVALHTMTNEHFGIGIVECMSAGLIMVAHDSGGPKLDIVIDHNAMKTGFLANDIDSFADALESVWKMDGRDLRLMRDNARQSMLRFSEQNFEDCLLSALRILFK